LAATGVGVAGATLNAAFVRVPTAPYAPHSPRFVYGTSVSALTQTASDNTTLITSSSGSFSAALSGLSENTTYYYKALLDVWDADAGKYVTVEGTVRQFTTASASGGSGGNPEAYAASWLINYEIPATDVSLTNVQKAFHSTVNETYGATRAFIYNPSSSRRRIVTHTFSYDSRTLRNYSLLFDYDKQCALWVAYAANNDCWVNNHVGRHNNAFTNDPAVPSNYQPGSVSGYTRGHQVASNDRQTTDPQNQQTFYYSNMTPQASALNSGKWNSLESKVQNLADRTTGRDTLYVVTGPIFDSGYNTVSGVPIPTRYYKCLMKCTFNASGEMTAAKGAAFLFLHEPRSGEEYEQSATIDDIEAITGFDLFANVPADKQSAAEATNTSFW
jgi:endonuclease G